MEIGIAQPVAKWSLPARTHAFPVENPSHVEATGVVGAVMTTALRVAVDTMTALLVAVAMTTAHRAAAGMMTIAGVQIGVAAVTITVQVPDAAGAVIEEAADGFVSAAAPFGGAREGSAGLLQSF